MEVSFFSGLVVQGQPKNHLQKILQRQREPFITKAIWQFITFT